MSEPGWTLSRPLKEWKSKSSVSSEGKRQDLTMIHSGLPVLSCEDVSILWMRTGHVTTKFLGVKQARAISEREFAARTAMLAVTTIRSRCFHYFRPLGLSSRRCEAPSITAHSNR